MEASVDMVPMEMDLTLNGPPPPSDDGSQPDDDHETWSQKATRVCLLPNNP